MAKGKPESEELIPLAALEAISSQDTWEHF
jgi:hypothetical protein